jgi:hypothetical protein
VGQKRYDNGNLLSNTNKNTALGFYYSGSWAHCWLEGGPNSGTLVNNALSTWVPDHQLVLILLNDPGFGGCGVAGRRFCLSALPGTRSLTSSDTGWAVSATNTASREPTEQANRVAPISRVAVEVKEIERLEHRGMPARI